MTADDLGLNALAKRLLAVQAAGMVVTAALYLRLGLTLKWTPNATAGVAVLALLGGLWLHHYLLPGTQTEKWIAQVVFVLVVSLVCANIAVLAQYPAIALGFPYADPWLAAADARLGVHVPALVGWTVRHPAVSYLLTIAYASHVPQFGLAVFGLGALRDREGLWEFVFHFHVCLAVAIVALAVWPALCAPAYYGFRPTIDITHVIAQIKGFHDGTLRIVNIDEVDGLVSFPSFHVAAALFVTWSFRRHRRIMAALIVLNIAMIAATMMSGLHYAIDVVAALPLCAVSLAAYRWWGVPLLRRERV